MTSFLLWYFIVTLLGWLTFPLLYMLFPALADRGYTLARAAGLLLWAYIFWLFASLGIAQNDTGGILFALLGLIAVSALSLTQHASRIMDFIKSNLAVILTTEILFLSAFAFLAFARSANPELYSTEKPMELAFINGILRSPTFPPQDPWLSGYAISYYYFGYVMTAMLARLADINGSMAHNLMLALVFALAAIGSYGILYNLLSQSSIVNRGLDTPSKTIRATRPPIVDHKSSIVNSFLAPLFLLLISNFEALLEILHRKGFFWTQDASGMLTSSFWTWLDMKELSLPPMQPFQWTPDRYLWWWRASRVIQDYDMTNSHREVIDEFPFFSFLLGDLHPHVLAIPFVLLAIGIALNFFLSRADDAPSLFGTRVRMSYPIFAFSALTVGGLAFLNTWDILPAGTLVVLAYVFARARDEGWTWERLEDLFIFGLPLGFLAVILYFPFYLGFSSQAGGILPNLMFITRGAHLWVMWGTLFIPIFAYLLFGVRQLAAAADGEPSDSRVAPNWKLAFGLGLGSALFLWAFSWLLGWFGSYVEPDFVVMFLASQGMTAGEFFAATTQRRLDHSGSLITLLALLIPALAYLFSKAEQDNDTDDSVHPSSFTVHHFVLLLITLAAFLVLAPEFVYLRDQFGYRINTVFKFYYQAWILWSLAAAFGAAILLDRLSSWRGILFRAALGIVIFTGLLYPVFGLANKTNNFNPVYEFTLDDFDRIQRESPDEAAAIDFLRTVPNGVIAEAVGDGYSSFARVSAHTGLQTVLGWPGHEAQWRGTYEPQGSRREDINTLYATFRWDEAQAIIEKYNIRYIFVGTLEQTSLRLSDEKFRQQLKVIFQQGNVTVYEVP